MKHRYTIMGRQHGSEREVDLVQCDSNPEALLQALKAKSLNIKKVQTPKYTWLRIVENKP